MPSFPIIDTHVHFWDPTAVPVSWTGEVSPLARPYHPHDLMAERGEVEIDRLVFVEANVDEGRSLAEVTWVEGVATAEPKVSAIVAHAPLEDGEACIPHIEALADRPLVRGVRRLLQDEEDEAFCLRPDFVQGVQALARVDMHFEICVFHPQLASAIELVRRCPSTLFVLDHIAKPGIADGLREPWTSQMKELAQLENAVCKLSGVVTEADHQRWTAQELRPYIDHALQTFGPERVMFGSDWPVMKIATTYERWVQLVDEAVATWSEDDRRKLFVTNAERVYRL